MVRYNSNNSGYEDSEKIGVEFEEFVCQILYIRFNWIIQLTKTKEAQLNYGDSFQKMEIKYDSRCFGDVESTERLSIEVAEKQKEDHLNFLPSGIYSRSEPLLYIQGNYNRFYVFWTRYLQMLHKERKEDGSFKFDRATHKTVEKFYLPVRMIEQNHYYILKN